MAVALTTHVLFTVTTASVISHTVTANNDKQITIYSTNGFIWLEFSTAK